MLHGTEDRGPLRPKQLSAVVLFGTMPLLKVVCTCRPRLAFTRLLVIANVMNLGSQSQMQKYICLLYDYIGVPEQTLGWFPLGLGLVIEDEPSELSCTEI